MGSSGLVLGSIRMQKIKMIRVPLMIFCLNTLSNAVPQGINFGGSSSNSNKEISNRNNQQNTNNKHFGSNSNNCCCIPEGNSCFNSQNGGDDLVGQGFIDERIVNRPNSGSNQGLTQSCPYRHKICCYPDNYDFSVFGRTCVPPTTGGSSSGFTSGSSAAWRQGCSESSVYGSNQCGTRTYGRPVSNLKYGEASPGEFPWTCLLLSQNNDFIGTCAVIPESFNNDNRAGTSKIITAAHNLKKIGFNE